MSSRKRKIPATKLSTKKQRLSVPTTRVLERVFDHTLGGYRNRRSLKAPIPAECDNKRTHHMVVERHSEGVPTDPFRSILPGADAVKRVTGKTISPGSLAHWELNDCSFGSRTRGPRNTRLFYASVKEMVRKLPRGATLNVWFENISRAVRSREGELELARLIEAGHFRPRFFGDVAADWCLDPENPQWRTDLARLAAVSIARTRIMSVESSARHASKRLAVINQEIATTKAHLHESSAALGLRMREFSKDLCSALTTPSSLERKVSAVENALSRIVDSSHTLLLRSRTGSIRPGVEGMLSTPDRDASGYPDNKCVNGKMMLDRFFAHMDRTLGDCFRTPTKEYSSGLMIRLGYGMPGSPLACLSESQLQALYDSVWYGIRLLWLQGMMRKNNVLLEDVARQFRAVVPTNEVLRQVVEPPAKQGIFSTVLHQAVGRFRSMLGLNLNLASCMQPQRPQPQRPQPQRPQPHAGDVAICMTRMRL